MDKGTEGEGEGVLRMVHQPQWIHLGSTVGTTPVICWKMMMVARYYYFVAVPRL